jgi:hypothetical protein
VFSAAMNDCMNQRQDFGDSTSSVWSLDCGYGRSLN